MKHSLVTTALAASLAVCWSSGFVGATLSTGTAPVATVLTWRTGICAVLLGVAVLVRGDRLPRAEVRRQIGRGTLVQGVYLGGTFAAAAAGVPAGTSALISALQPLLVVGLAVPMLGTRPTGRQLLGLGLGAVGVATVVAGDLGGAPAWAFLLPVLAVVGLAAGTVLEGRRPASSLLMAFCIHTATATVLFGGVAGVRGELAPPASGDFWFAVAWLVVLSSFGGYGTYLLLIRRNGPTLTSALLYLTPPTTALWAWAMFGQVPGPLAVPGAVITAVGIAVFASRRRRSRVSDGRVPAQRTPPRSSAGLASRGRPGAVAPTPQPAFRR